MYLRDERTKILGHLPQKPYFIHPKEQSNTGLKFNAILRIHIEIVFISVIQLISCDYIAVHYNNYSSKALRGESVTTTKNIIVFKIVSRSLDREKRNRWEALNIVKSESICDNAFHKSDASYLDSDV